MHDLHAADQILKIALDQANENKLMKIDRMVIELGSIVEHGEQISPENLKFNLKVLAKNTPAKNCRVIIKRVRSDGYRLVEIDGK